MSEMTALCERKRVKIEATITGEPIPDGFDRGGNAWKIRLTYQGRRLTVPFYTGSLAGEPSAADVISCLISDARAGEQDFESFCSDFGHDTDSRKAEKTWNACKKTGPRVRAFLREDFEAFERAEH
jgi:hypothetical protein